MQKLHNRASASAFAAVAGCTARAARAAWPSRRIEASAICAALPLFDTTVARAASTAAIMPARRTARAWRGAERAASTAKTATGSVADAFALVGI